MADNYFPSNGTEGMIFWDRNCFRCYKEKQCSILTNSLIGKEPKQWVYNEEGIPICTSLRTDRPKTKKKAINNQPKLFNV